MSEIIFAVCAVVITTASVFSIMHNGGQKKEYPCDSCDHLLRKREKTNTSDYRYVCDRGSLSGRGFDNAPIYCKHYEKREQEEEKS